MAAWSAAGDSVVGVELLPVRLARACVAVLPVDGAGLSVMSGDFRVPLGGSDDTATVGERLQFTQGQGPCLEAALNRHPVLAGPQELEQRWPAFTQELFAHTPYRAVMTLPLRLDADTHGALDLFFIDASRLEDVGLADAFIVVQRITDALTIARRIGAPAFAGEESAMPAWLHGPAARDRTYVWVAMGMVMAQGNTTASDALALLRSYAYGHDTTLDQLAGDLIDGNLDLASLAL